ncbi:phospholipase A2 inhibitor and Ly6/PLAUR domain-containing protein [Xenopus laevis]|uniref:Phospholipase A2 inhibitor and Ly6/PLAUR domain-containing protein n=1 Tax=Xenopus laevis TaxID=8355 RepID=A0A8J0TC19_XENLA|nr:phospholipase A2 inhibitor and Ly6/PLAUR domain-containing protein [Xenopus laevis]
MYWVFILCVLSCFAGSGFCLSCIHCTSNNGLTCSGTPKNCTGLSVCMSTVAQTTTYTKQVANTFKRNCGEPQDCSAGSLSSYLITTVTNSTCCFNDSCTPPTPTLPTYRSETKNGAVCKTCFAQDERECLRFNTTMCTGSETFCVEYEVRTEAGTTIVWGCSSENFCHNEESKKFINDDDEEEELAIVIAKCSRSEANVQRFQIIYLLATLLLDLLLLLLSSEIQSNNMTN